MPIIHKKPQAELDLLDIWDYIADESFDRADQFLDLIGEKLEMLANNPALGRVRNEFSDVYTTTNISSQFRLVVVVCRSSRKTFTMKVSYELGTISLLSPQKFC